jgi:hypothetical protein
MQRGRIGGIVKAPNPPNPPAPRKVPAIIVFIICISAIGRKFT